jgi:hypothetical protein
VFWRPPPPVDTPIRNWPNLRLTVPVPHKGRYRVTLVHTVVPDYAWVRVFLDGKAVADFDGYAEKVRYPPAPVRRVMARILAQTRAA